MEIKLRKEMFPALLNGTKTSTNRLGKRDVSVGENLYFVMTEDANITFSSKVSNVSYCTFGELTEEEAIREGYSNLPELKNALNKIYHPTNDDIFTLIEFETH